MIRFSTILTTAIVAGVALAGSARAQTATTVTTTSSTTSTSTTLLPHPFSKGTKSCVKDARQAYRSCAGTKDQCRKDFETAYAKCFAGSTGQKCAAKCLTNESKCITAVPDTKKTCRKACRLALVKDVKACRRFTHGDDEIWAGGDQGCLVTARLTASTCRFTCAGSRDVCFTNFRFCIADCPNL